MRNLCGILAIYFMLIVAQFGCNTGKHSSRIKADVLRTSDTVKKITAAIEISKKYDSLQIEFGEKLGVPYDSIRNLKLYSFIKNNLDKKCGVADNEKYACEAFLSSLYKEVYKIDLPVNIAAQMKSAEIELYTDTSYLKEGDVLFFNLSDEQSNKIAYNGFYLTNGFFLIASFNNGIIITEIKKTFWTKRFAAAGRIKQQFIGSTIK